jgi:glycosyltransferase involved in cell wall biosynthesis
MTASAGSRRLKVLFFAQRFPYPMDTGGKIRTGKLLEYLRQVFDVTLISNVESPKDDPYLGQVGKLCAEFYPVPWKEVRKYSFMFYVRVLAKTFSRYPISVSNDYSPDLERTLLEVLQKSKYDLLICDFLQPSINCTKVTGCPTLLFQHNVEAVIPSRHYEIAGDPISKIFWWLQWKKMERYEQAACHKFHGVIAVSEKDKQLFEEQYGARNVFAIPTGVDTEYFSPRNELAEADSLVFTGSMDWLPNEDAVLFFARDILWRIKGSIPNIRLTVVGRNPSRRLMAELERYPEINVVGWVKDVRPYISRHSVYVIPLRIGGGTRIKAFEALAMGKPMVSTTIGTEGLPLIHNQHLLLSDRAEDFSAAVVRLLQDPTERSRLGTNASHFVREHFDWAKVGQHFSNVCYRIAGSKLD